MAGQEAVVIRLSDAALDELSKCTSKGERGRKLLALINERLERFNEWCTRELDGPMAKFELAAIRTYIYREITGELDGEGNIDDLPRVQLGATHPALV